MKKSNLFPSKLRNPVICFLTVILSGGSVVNAQPFKLFAVSDIQRVFEDGYKLPHAYDTVSMFGIRGEIISGQLAAGAKNSLTNVSVELSTLKNLATGNSLPANSVEWNFVGSVPLIKNAPNQPLSAVERLAPARFPDYLMAEKKLNINKGMYQAVWLTISIPEKAEPGFYSGKVTVKSVQGEQSLPISVTIYPLDLPYERHLKIAERYTLDNFAQYHGIDEMYSDSWFKMLKIYADNMVAHRQNVMQMPINSIGITKLKNGELSFDFSRFDQIAQVFYTKKMDFIETGYGWTKFGEGDWFSTEIKLSDLPVKIQETGEQVKLPGKDVIPYLLPAFESHLRQKGWLDKTLLSVRNEPSIHNSVAYCEMSDYFHQLAPDLKQFESLETTMFGGVEIPGPKIDHLATWYDTYKKAQDRGVELCYYIVGIYQGSRYPNKTIDVPVMDSRIMPWLNCKYELSGIKHWGWNQWRGGNPYQEMGIHIGDGWHVYPVKNGLLNSLRWEQMRNGIQDFEYLWMLENKISALKDSLGSQFSWIDPKQRSKEIAGQVVMSFLDRTNDPQVLYQAKKDVIRELLEFNNSPRIYVQTDPVVNSTITSQSSVIVEGWTEPGTKIIVNGQELPVSKQGCFMEQFLMSPEENNIKVQASKANVSREIIRHFVVK